MAGEAETDGLARVAEQPPPGSETVGATHEPERVDEAGRQQCAAEAGAAVDLEFPSRLRLEFPTVSTGSP